MPESNSPRGAQAILLAVFAVITGVVGGPALIDASGGRGGAGAGAGAANGRSAAGAGVAGAGAPAGLPTVSIRSPQRPFQEFWEGATGDAGKDLAQELIRHSDQLTPEFLIATVPDPIDSRFGYRFDAVVDDIQMAIESLSWNLDRFWLPWLPEGSQPARRDLLKPSFDPPADKGKAFDLAGPLLGWPALSGRYGLPAESARAASKSALHEQHPGVLLFRRPREPGDRRWTQQILVVFLVGERPTSGVHKAALGEALNIIDFHARGTTRPSAIGARPTQFLIVGPAFSGSERSISAVISAWTSRRLAEVSAGPLRAARGLLRAPIGRGPRLPGPWAASLAAASPGPAGLLDGSLSIARAIPPAVGLPRLPPNLMPWTALWEFRVRSGAANHLDVDRFRHNCGDDGWGPVRVRLDSTLHHFDRVLRETFHYLKELNGGANLGKVALLTESDTQFGNYAVPPRKSKAPEAARAPGAKGADLIEEIGTITQMKFPFHVSQVAIAYDQNRTADDRTTPKLGHFSSKLHIPFDETGNPRDIVPSLSPAMGAATDEFNLAKILETISQEDYRYVGIVATDTRDIVFLAGLIREYCPDVQLFTPVGDLLLGHPTYASQLRGMIVTSTYPLFSMAQRWDPPHKGDRRRNLFMHEADQGYFNATLSLLGPGDPQLLRKECDDPNGARNNYAGFLYDYGKPFDEMDLLDGSYRNPRGDRPYRDQVTSPPMWLGVIGQRGLWPLKSVADKAKDWGTDWAQEDRKFLFRLSPADLPVAASAPGDAAPACPAVPPLIHQEGAGDEPFFPLIPQFTWLWGLIVLALGLASWSMLRAHWQLALDQAPPIRPGGPPPASEPGARPRPGRAIGLLRPHEGGAPRPALRAQQEGFVAAALAVLAVVCGYFSVMPCCLTLRHSAWPHFFGWSLAPGLPHPRVVPHAWVLPWGDLWNWLFGLVAIGVAGASIAALAAAAALRIHLARAMGLGARWRLAIAAFALVLIAEATLDPPAWSWDLRAAAALLGRALDATILAGAAAATPWLLIRAQGDPARAGRIRLAAVGLIPPAAGAAILLVNAAFARPTPPYDSFLFLERAVNLGNGVSPLVPVLLLGLSAAAWIVSQLHRIDYIGRLWRNPASTPADAPATQAAGTSTHRGRAAGRLTRAADDALKSLAEALSPPAEPARNPLALELVDEAPPFAAVRERKDRLFAASQDILRQLDRPIPAGMIRDPACLVALSLAVLVGLRLIQRFVPTVDGLAYNGAMVVAFSALIFVIVLSLSRFLLTWRAVHALLKEFALLPMQRAFDRVPESLSREAGPYLNSRQPRVQNLEITVRQWARVADGFHKVRADIQAGLFGEWAVEAEISEKLGVPARALVISAAKAPEKMNILASAFSTPMFAPLYLGEPGFRILKLFEEECADPTNSANLWRSRVRKGLRAAAGGCLSVLIPYWRSRSIDEGYGSRDAAAHAPAHADAPAPATPQGECATSPWTEPARRWLEQVEDLLALELVNFVGECTVHLRNLAGFLAIGPLLLLLAATSYPFQPQRFLLVSIWGVLLAVAGGVLWTYIQMERNEVLSRVSKTSPDRVSLNWTFLTQAAAILVPLLGAVLTQFPFASDSFNQWLDPVVRILK